MEGAKIKWKYLLDTACLLADEQKRQVRKMRIKRYGGFELSGLRRANFKQSSIYLKCLLMTVKIKI